MVAAEPPSPTVLTYSDSLQERDEVEESMSAEEEERLLAVGPTTTPTAGVRGTHDLVQAKRALRGFFAYSIASEIFVIVAGTLFLPVLLETYARENGKLGPDFTRHCPSSVGDAPIEEDQRCSVKVLGLLIDTASFSLYTYSASVLIQALTVISMGSLADDVRVRHRLLSPFWGLCVLIAVVANVSFGASIVCLNSYLPALGRSDPKVAMLERQMHEARARLKSVRSASSRRSSDAILSASQAVVRATDEYNTAKGLVTSHFSARAIAAGYAAGISALIFMLVPITLTNGTTWSLRCAIAGSGMLWALGTIPAAIYLRPSQVVAQEELPASSIGLLQSLRNGWAGLLSMLRDWRQLPTTFVYLSAWFLLSDAFATVTSTAILFAKTTLAMPTESLILIAILTPMSGIFGAVAFPRLQSETLHWSNLKMVMLLVACATSVPMWGIVALRTRWQIYLLSVVFGVVFGAFQAFSRTCFSELVPHTQSARWFGLYSITDKSSSFLGPLLVALITNATGEIRHGFWLILIMLLLRQASTHLAAHGDSSDIE
ncbi:Autophagy protein 22 [Microbotryomycetes sp. JL221]|nr:Autophagy protein 22 [Microbotryomycetes sp. JL221]